MISVSIVDTATSKLFVLPRQVLDLLLAHVSEECDACEAASGRVCSACLSGDKLYPFQVQQEGLRLLSHPHDCMVDEPS